MKVIIASLSRVLDCIECRGPRVFLREGFPCIKHTSHYFVTTLLYSTLLGFLGMFSLDVLMRKGENERWKDLSSIFLMFPKYRRLLLLLVIKTRGINFVYIPLKCAFTDFLQNTRNIVHFLYES